MTLLKAIESAFRDRPRPLVMEVSGEMAAHEARDVARIFGREWRALGCDELERSFELIYWLAPVAFCYYLPGILSAGVREDRPNLVVYHSLVRMLDRSPDPESWDAFFAERWSLLSPEECDAVQQWLIWLASLSNSPFDSIALGRGFDTLELLKQCGEAARSPSRLG